jgi:hypothetical protein
MRRKRFIIAAMAFVAVAAVAIAFMWSTDIARIRCADGSSLVIQMATFGTNHHALSAPRWHPLSMRDSSLLRRGWEMMRDTFRSPTNRLHRSSPFEWRTKSPAIALWGAWDARGQKAHVLRFVLVDDSGQQLATLTSHLSFGEKEREGLVATTTNLPSTRSLRVRVFDDTHREQPTTLGEFVVRNELF